MLLIVRLADNACVVRGDTVELNLITLRRNP